jgi:hypothetical protein
MNEGEQRLYIRGEQKRQLKLMALRHGYTLNEELAQMISDRTFLEEKIATGAIICVREADGTIKGLTFHPGQNPDSQDAPRFHEADSGVKYLHAGKRNIKGTVKRLFGM